MPDNYGFKTPRPDELESLKPFVNSHTQIRNIEAVLEYGNYQAAADAIGVARQSIIGSLQRLKKNAIKRGWSPEHDMTQATPDGFGVSGVSSYYRTTKNPETGEVEKELRGQWVKTKSLEEDRIQRILEAVEDVMANADPIATIAAPEVVTTGDLLTVYPMGDPHIGMYAWAEEAGEDFDVKIAERDLTNAMKRLVESAPASEQALIVNVGDFFHSDTSDNRTSRSGHALDVDTRWSNVLRVGIRAMRTCIEFALAKHQTVRVINEIGNHDDHTAQLLTLALSLAYEKNPRVSFDENPGRFHYFRFGDVLIGVTHGDTVKPDKLGGIMATDRPTDWGETVRRYWYTGHIHTRNVFELPGCEVESFRTLAAKDAWTASMGYRSGRDMYCIVIHKKFGEIERHRKDILMLRD